MHSIAIKRDAGNFTNRIFSATKWSLLVYNIITAISTLTAIAIKPIHFDLRFGFRLSHVIFVFSVILLLRQKQNIKILVLFLSLITIMTAKF